ATGRCSYLRSPEHGHPQRGGEASQEGAARRTFGELAGDSVESILIHGNPPVPRIPPGQGACIARNIHLRAVPCTTGQKGEVADVDSKGLPIARPSLHPPATRRR